MREKFNITIISRGFDSYRYIINVKDCRINKLFIEKLIITKDMLEVYVTVKLTKKQSLPIDLIKNININLSNLDNKYVGLSVV